MNSKSMSALTQKIESFPTLPTIVTRILEITSNPTSSAEDLMKVISQDPSLTTTILKMANSAFFGLAREVGSLKHALTILGFGEIRNLVLAKAVFESFKNIKKSGKFDIRTFWEHSFITGIAAKIVANSFRRDTNEFFVAGLIHDIGKLIIFITLPSEFETIMEKVGTSMYGSIGEEKKLLGVTHSDLGLRLLKKWMFPENLLMAVGYHHTPDGLPKTSPFAIVVQTADILAHITKMEDNPELEPQLQIETQAEKILKLSAPLDVKWDIDKVIHFKEELSVKKQEEAAALSLFLS